MKKPRPEQLTYFLMKSFYSDLNVCISWIKCVLLIDSNRCRLWRTLHEVKVTSVGHFAPIRSLIFRMAVVSISIRPFTAPHLRVLWITAWVIMGHFNVAQLSIFCCPEQQQQQQQQRAITQPLLLHSTPLEFCQRIIASIQYTVASINCFNPVQLFLCKPTNAAETTSVRPLQPKLAHGRMRVTCFVM